MTKIDIFNTDDVRVSINGSVASAGNIHWTFIYPDLYIQHAQPQHAGKYTCFGSNEAGNASSSGWLIVHSKCDTPFCKLVSWQIIF